LMGSSSPIGSVEPIVNQSTGESVHLDPKTVADAIA
jgi:hypothetical protein